MKSILFFLLIILAGCNTNDQQNTKESETETIVKDEVVISEKTVDTAVLRQTDVKDPIEPAQSKTYSNQRFKGVTVTKTGDQEFSIEGKAQIFEASFSWVVEDGHEELKQGYNTTDAGAPAWGNFSFTINAPKKRSNSTLHLILFELSAKDGSRQHELPILLY